MLKKIVTVVTVALVAGQLFAGQAAIKEAKQVVELKDGSTLYIFRDGKMAVEDRYGHAKSMRPNTELEGKDGQRYQLQGNEVGRLEKLLNDDRGY